MALIAALENYNCLSFVKNWPQFIIIIVIVFFASQVIYTQEILL